MSTVSRPDLADGTYAPSMAGGKRRLVAFWASVGAVLLTLVGVPAWWVMHNFGPATVKDPAAMSQYRERLRPVLAELDTLPDSGYAHASRPAQFVGCGTDSGEIMEPEAYRIWHLNRDAIPSDGLQVSDGGQQAAGHIAAQLIGRGWHGSRHLDGSLSTRLWKPQGDHKVYVSIQAFNDEVLVEADTPSKRLCRRLI